MQFLLLAQDQPAAPPAGGQPGSACGAQLIMMVVIMGIFWFLLIRPQQKAEKARRARLSAIQKGDRVRTRGGILATVARVQDDELTLRIDVENKVQVVIAKAYVDEVLTESAAETKAD